MNDILNAFSYKSPDFNPCIRIMKLVIIAPVLQVRKMELRELTDLPRILKLIAEMVFDLGSFLSFFTFCNAQAAVVIYS